MVKVIKKVYDDRANEYKFEAVNGGVTSVNGQTGDVTIEEPIEYTAGNGISIGNLSISSRQGPCEEGFHVPSAADWQGVETIMNGLGFFDGADWDTKLHLPKAGYRRYSDGEKVVGYSGATGVYWSTSRDSDTYSYKVFTLAFDSSNVGTRESECRAIAASIRPFKNAYVAPDATWTVIYGTLGSAGIFWNQTEGLISITDGTNGYTMADKNLGATTVYSSGNTLSEANCGYLYQWGNNYAFPWSGSVTTSSTLVNASSYGPGNYYSSSTFITVSSNPRDWSSVQNNDLWGDTTNTTTNINNAISNTGVLSINGQTGAVTVNEGDVKVFAVPSVNDDISDMITRISAGKGVILHEMVSGTDAFYKVDYHDDVNCEITASLIYSYNGGYARVYTIEYNYSTKRVITKTPSLIYFFAPETAGTLGQVLKKTNSGYEWANASGGLQVAPNSPITGIKYVWYGTEADYNNLSQYYTDTPGDTEFRCF